MKNSKKIVLTIGIPVYNVEKYIRDLLEELSKINEPSIEALLIDDGSSDESLAICKEYQSDTIRVYSQKNKGPSETRNRIISLSRGDWIAFVDSDDLIDSKEFCELLNILDKTNDLYINVPDKAAYERLLKMRDDDAKLSFLVESEIINSPCGKIYKSDFIKKEALLFNSAVSIGEDLLFNVLFLANNPKYAILSRRLNIIRQNQESLTRRFNKNKYKELMKVNDACCDCYVNNKKVLNSFIYIRVKNCFSCLKDCNKFKDKNRYIKKINSTKIPNRIFLNNLKTSFVYWVWRLSPKPLLCKAICKKR